MKLGVRSKLFLASFGLLTLTLLAADLVLTRGLDEQLSERIRGDLFVRLRLIEHDISAIPVDLTNTSEWDKVADSLGSRSSARVTIIRGDGVVIGDSEVVEAELAHVANHGHRPEILQAIAVGSGTTTRNSETTHVRMMYSAVPFQHLGAPAGVVRVAVPLVEIDAAISALQKLVLLATGIGLGIAALMSSLSAHFMARAGRALTAAARRMASGDLDVRTRVSGGDEVAELSAALDQLAESLSAALRELRGERDLLAAVLDGMQEGVMVIDDAGRVLRVNPALRSMLLLGPETVGRPLLEVVRHADLAELLSEARERPAAREIDLSGIKPRRLSVRAGPLSDGARMQLAVFVDVTDIRRLETLRRDFVANVSHELRTPVTSVLSAAETLEVAMTRDPETTARFLQIIRRNAGRLQLLIEDLLDLSKIESRELRLRPEPVELDPFVAHAVSLARSRAEDRGVKLVADVARGCPPALADRRALEQVITNLIDNAVKYCPGAEVRVSAASEGGRALIAVKDAGPGIDARHLPRLFERFYRVDAGRSREVGGTGLGLSIVKHLVEGMDGSITVASEVGAGTTFTVTLPLAAAIDTRNESTRHRSVTELP